MSEIGNAINRDFSELYSYLPTSLLVGLIAVILFLGCIKIRSQKYIWWKSFLFGSFLAYVSQMMQIAFFSREPGSRIEVSLKVLETWTEDPQGRAYVIENVMFFIPFAILLSAFIYQNKKRRYFFVPLVGVLSSSLLEGLQLLTGRGYFQVDDILANSVGTLIGFGVFMIGLGICKLIKKVFKLSPESAMPTERRVGDSG